MTEYMHRAIIIVPAAARTAANTNARKVDPVGGERTFTVGLSPPGLLPPTHYWCSWAMTKQQWATIMAGYAFIDAQGTPTPAGRLYDANTWSPEQVLQATGLQRIKETRLS